MQVRPGDIVLADEDGVVIVAQEMAREVAETVLEVLPLEAELEDVPAVAELLRQTMEEAVELSVPLKTEVRAGPNWDGLAPVPELVTRA